MREESGVQRGPGAAARRGLAGPLIFLIVALVLSLAASLCLGPVNMSLSELWAALSRASAADPAHQVIVWELRLPRALLAALVGGALAVAGATFQVLFRNGLADPYVMGASSGAALGATLALSLGWSASSGGLGWLPWLAFAGALGAVAVALLLAEAGGASSVGSLLLAGTALSTLLTAAVSFLLLWREQPWFQAFNWLLGGFSGRNWSHVGLAAPYCLICGGLLWWVGRPLDALATSDETAGSLGLPVRGVRLGLIALATLAVAAAVAVGGVIGFVGLVAPHVGRLWLGAGHRRLLPVSTLLGAILLVWADVAARTVLAPVEVPVGIVTAALGGPFFLYLLKVRGGRLT